VPKFLELLHRAKEIPSFAFEVILILDVSKICYEDPLKCNVSVTSLALGTVNESVFVLPPLPSASFRFMTPDKGVWSRDESVKYMTKDVPIKSPLSIRQAGKWEQASSFVLLVTGVLLKEAEFRFENRSISVIPLVASSTSYPEKIKNGEAILVIETNRGNPGWQDIDIDATRVSLWEKDMPNADGVFYVIVRDGFGRSTRFDIEYEKWERSETTYNNTTYTEHRFEWQNHWWSPNSNGTDVFNYDGFTTHVASMTTDTVTH
jgi:hypothetical protein